jgi:hypothetical protein
VGVAHVADEKTIVFPSYNGNGMYFSAGNISATGKVGMLFIDMCTPHRVRVQGTAALSQNEDHMKRFPGAEFVVEVTVNKVFINCARYIHKHQRIEGTSRYVPDENGEAPLPAWKRIDMIQEALPEEDLSRWPKAAARLPKTSQAEGDGRDVLRPFLCPKLTSGHDPCPKRTRTISVVARTCFAAPERKAVAKDA